MGKYNSYAKQLDEAFKGARDQYVKALEALHAAQKKYD